MIGDYLQFALRGILHRRLRSWLTMLGIFVGIMAVVALISLGEGLQQGINEQFEKVGGNRLIITPGGGGVQMGGGAFASAILYEKDLEAVQETRGVEYAIGILREAMRATYEGTDGSTIVMGVSTDRETRSHMEDFAFLSVVEGDYIREGSKYDAVVGPETGENFGSDVVLEIGDEFEIKGHEFEVVGVTEKIGDPVNDHKIVLPLETVEEMTGKHGEYSTISGKVAENYNTNEVAEDVEEELRESRDVKEDEEDFTVQTSQDLISSFNNILAIVRLVLTGIAGISLIVGGIGIMTTMYTSVIERTRQIGIMKAVGAQNQDILLIFIFEAGMLGLIGGVIGVILGLALSFGVEDLARRTGLEILKAYFSIPLVVGALLFSFIVGCVSGVFPARKAAKMKPVDAVRY